MPDGNAVRSMFAGISSRYDSANRILSGGSDIYWRRVLVRKVAARNPADIADLATGSGDVAFALKRGLGDGVKIRGYDFCAEMLDEARHKQSGGKGNGGIEFAIGDCLNLPIADESLDALTIAFGLRNLEDRARGLSEMARVLRPGGALHVLEFSQPYRWFRPVYYAYLRHILPHLARLATGNRSAYDYLVGSIESFPERDALAEEIKSAGKFSEVSAKPLTFGIVAIHTAVK
ncbi:MAG: ubiquinone/menaquinone biosynthesis methyltransferase [Opitutales bacterium]|nr:ubiquinone/menaquinone biosynthesis methyltransferase [Opitutales bacterium]